MMNFHKNVLMYYSVSDRTGEQTQAYFPVFLTSALTEKQSPFPAAVTFSSLLKHRIESQF